MKKIKKKKFPKNWEWIEVRGASEHNLKSVNLKIPRDAITVITGLSGSGKSSLAFDTIYAEGQRRYIESLSAYARQFLQQISKPNVESISGLSPSIAIDQKTISSNRRSTVGTLTELNDYLRLLFAQLAHPICWSCKKELLSQSPQQIIEQVLAFPPHARIFILAPIVRARKGSYQRELLELREQGFMRARIDGQMHDLDERIVLEKNKKHTIEVLIDRFVIKEKKQEMPQVQLEEAIQLALRMGSGQMLVSLFFELEGRKQPTEDRLFSETFACLECQVSYPKPEPRTFSFNSPMGACPACEGLGSLEFSDIESNICKVCSGMRLKKESLAFLIGGKSLGELCALSIAELQDFLLGLKLSQREASICERILSELQTRLSFLIEIGASYLSLDRSAQSLSGGESQRIRLARQMGSALVGVSYVLDEPSIGLHPRDHDHLMSALEVLRDKGNTIIIVEHDRETMQRADWLVDLGPGAGQEGGELVGIGAPSDFVRTSNGLTAKYLRGELMIKRPQSRRPFDAKKTIHLAGVKTNNLKNLSLDFPLGLFTCITGVSGSGKSTLVIDVLSQLLSSFLNSDLGNRKFESNFGIKSYSGLEQIDKLVHIDQSPIGRTPRSSPATYTGLFTVIRELFAALPESQLRAYGPSRYSFNVKGGRCETCFGDGLKKVEMHFLPDAYVSCDVCAGKRYQRETLEVLYKGKSIADILDMTVNEAYYFFQAIPIAFQKLSVLKEVGLTYLTLGQNALSLSGGEAQRIKLSKELSRRSTGKTLYILDEPSTGLHMSDVQKLIDILQKLVSLGNTVIVIEHNLDLIQSADYLLDLGPQGGKEGGYLLASGTPEQIAQSKGSDTGRFLKDYFAAI